MQKLKAVAWSTFSPLSLGLPVLLILVWPVLLWLWLDSHYTSFLTGSVMVLSWTLWWARIPGFFLLRNFFPVLIPLSLEEAIAAYVLPLAILIPLVYWALARKWSKPRALWLALAWSFFLLQFMGSIPMVYLWYIGA
jgi:hypothetical protein